MALVIRELHPAAAKDELNQEWITIENTGANALSTKGCSVAIAQNGKARPRPLGTIDPGFTIKPGEKFRMITGTGSKAAQGKPPTDGDFKNYHLFLQAPILTGPGVVVRLVLRQAEWAKATFAPAAPNGIGE